MTISLSRRAVFAGLGVSVAALSRNDVMAAAAMQDNEGNSDMTEEEIRSLFDRYIAVLNLHEMDRMTEFVHDEVVQNMKQVRRADVIADLKGHIDAVPDFQWRVLDVVVEGNTIAARLFNIGTPAKLWLGVEPTGRTVETLEFAFHKARDGKFYEMNYAMDAIGLQKQLSR